MKTLAIFLCLLIPTLAAAQQPPKLCDREHVATAHKPAPCSGVIMPAKAALDGAQCLDAHLPACQALRDRDRAAAARAVVALSRDATEANARADRWRELALVPAPSLPARVIVRSRGLSLWATGAIAAGSALIGGWLAWRIAH